MIIPSSMLRFRFIFLVGASAACKCFHKTIPLSPSKYATEAACQEARGKIRYSPEGGFDCNAHTVSKILHKFSIWCSVYGNCSDCRCPHGCSNKCPKYLAISEVNVRDEMEDNDDDVWITDDGANLETGDVDNEGK